MDLWISGCKIKGAIASEFQFAKRIGAIALSVMKKNREEFLQDSQNSFVTVNDRDKPTL